jgi:hypothetical protein
MDEWFKANVALLRAVLGKYRNLSDFHDYFAPFDYQVASMRVRHNPSNRRNPY